MYRRKTKAITSQPQTASSSTQSQAPKRERSPRSQASSEGKEVARACCLAEAQAPVQAFLRPGMWLPGVRRLHMARESWLMEGTPEECLGEFLKGVNNIAEEEHLQVHKVERMRHFVQIYSFTPGCNWLDVAEVQFQSGEQSGTTAAETLSFSSGLFPTWCPLSFVCSALCFCAPFSGNGVNTHRLSALRKAMQREVTVTAEVKCPCCPS